MLAGVIYRLIGKAVVKLGLRVVRRRYGTALKGGVAVALAVAVLALLLSRRDD